MSTARRGADLPPRDGGGVQAVNRAFDLLEAMAGSRAPMSVADLAGQVGLPAPTVHRLLRTLVARGLARQLPDRRYALGLRLMALGNAIGSATGMTGMVRTDVLHRLVDRFGETVNVALLVGDEAEYVAQVPSPHAMRMFIEVGRRVELHCTGVGKALLARQDDEQVARVVARRGLPGHTDHTITTVDALRQELAVVRGRGYAIDEQEQELGVRCVALPFDVGPGVWMAVSVSGPVTRMDDELVAAAVPLLAAAASALRDDLLGVESRVLAAAGTDG